MSRMPEPWELDPVAVGLIRAGLTGDKFATNRILTRAVEADLDGLFYDYITSIRRLAGSGRTPGAASSCSRPGSWRCWAQG